MTGAEPLLLAAGLAGVAACAFIVRERPITRTGSTQNIIYSACDGIVLHASQIEAVVAVSWLDQRQVKMPANGVIKAFEYEAAYTPLHTGGHRVPEKSTTVIGSIFGEIRVSQRGGLWPHSKKWFSSLEIGDSARRGDTIGFVRPGARVGVRVKYPDGYRCLVNPGTRVRAGETALFIKD